MNIADLLVEELLREAELTKRVLERVPADKLSWKPHEKSMSLGQLALHMAGVPGALAELLNEPIREAPVVPLPEAATVEEILAAHEQSMVDAERRLREWGEPGLEETWTLTAGGAVALQAPRLEMARTLILNHWYHHRGQLTVYLRLLDVPLPPVYGPTADDNLRPAEQD